MGQRESEQVKYYDGAARAAIRSNIAIVRRGIEVEGCKGSRALLSKSRTKGKAEKDRKDATDRMWHASRHELPTYDANLGRSNRGGLRCGACLHGPKGATRTGIEEFLCGGCVARGDVDVQDSSEREAAPVSTSEEDDAQPACGADLERQDFYDWEMGCGEEATGPSSLGGFAPNGNATAQGGARPTSAARLAQRAVGPTCVSKVGFGGVCPAPGGVDPTSAHLGGTCDGWGGALTRSSADAKVPGGVCPPVRLPRHQGA